MQAMRYTRTPAKYAKKMVALQCPSDDHWKSGAARILESMAPKSIRYSNREHAYIVSQRTADLFEKKVIEYLVTEGQKVA